MQLGRRSLLLAATAGTATAATAATAAPAAAEPRKGPVVIGHRGAAGWRPEHTAASYAYAVQTGADWIEPDLVPTKDHVLVVRHENEISQTTDVAGHPEFADRRTTKTVDGRAVTGWFTEDFTLAELKTLRAVERLPQVRNRNTVFDGREEVMTFQEVVELARRLSRSHGRTIAVFPETKHPTYFRSLGLPLEPKLAAVIRRERLGRRECVVQSFEPTSLQRMTGLGVPLWQALGTTGGPYDLPGRTYKEMMTPAGLAEIAEYADWIGPDKASLVGTSLLADAHAAGLRVGPYTFRAENQFLPAQFRRGSGANDFGDAFAEYALYYRWGVDAVVTDFPDLAVMARRG
ncbi:MULTISPECIES: glycerophosphodiester phosphodiesterase family protein [Streptomyces]|uniref:glycerophosphodiester phosphodiesterase n=1 Tax=Streptomyces koelreuteriae TaxID=2838015 RepID=A0ABX8FWG8_9ACTN|nr:MULTISPECIES: glycerophosphodiester phosphodiesterase family protein [Streptomyces]QWB25573.1 glycerophosphodiester phosphodiesterase [Streptomyces koelreuteriae]UUA08621.1 glycerophosphodiester phosphodiesterase [Streptomyces koelreuteriae]UUA16226.1 glycerophosphodiester phosphodiesterase [Streptomyces sp. CRCS-T-1]